MFKDIVEKDLLVPLDIFIHLHNWQSGMYGNYINKKILKDLLDWIFVDFLVLIVPAAVVFEEIHNRHERFCFIDNLCLLHYLCYNYL